MTIKFTALECIQKHGTPGRGFLDYEFLNPDGSRYTGPLWSKSSLEKFISCQRKWGWQWIGGVKEPMGNAAKLGVDLHGEIENWLKNGSPPSDKIITESGALSVLPLPGSAGLRTEHVFAMRVDWDGPDGKPRTSGFWGFKDASLPHAPGFLPTVFDLKTKRDLLYAMSREELSDDLQACIYGLHACIESNSPAAALKWVYIQTQGKPRCHVTDVTLDRADMEAIVVPQLDKLSAMEYLLAQKSQLSVLDIPANPTYCAEYGGCFYRTAHCTDLKAGTGLMARLHHDRHENQRRKARNPAAPDAAESEPPMAINPVLARIQADLAKRSAANGTPAPDVAATVAAAPAVPVATASEPRPEPVAPAIPHLPTVTAAEPSVQTAPNAAPGVSARLAKLKDMLAASAAPAAQPAPAAAHVPVYDALATAAPSQPISAGVLFAAESAAAQPAPAAPADLNPASLRAEDNVPAPAPKKRGRPSKADLAARAAIAAVPVVMPGTTGLHLYIDVLPVKGIALASIDDLIAPVRYRVESEDGDGAGMPYRLIEYGKGPALLAAALEEDFRANPPVGAYHVTSKTIDAPVLEVLMRVANAVVKGTW